MRWSVVVPVFNEREYLPATLASLLAQTEPAMLLIVDNGSTDGCIDAARAQLDAGGARYRILEAPTPGQVHALKRGIDAVDTDLVAICDADTIYPAHYLAEAGRLFDRGGAGTVAAAACMVPERRGWRAGLSVWKRRAVLRLLPRQNHVSGAAQLFRTGALRRAGGYDPAIWPYVLKDHELMQRVLKLGRQTSSGSLWCMSSERRQDRRAVRWTLGERILYHLTPFGAKDRFFHGFLAGRFAARGQRDTVLRQRQWADA